VPQHQKTHVYSYLHLGEQPYQIKLYLIVGVLQKLENLLSILILVVLGCAKAFGSAGFFCARVVPNVGLGATPTLAQRLGKSKQVNLYPAST
jgi:hypothetical protein